VAAAGFEPANITEDREKVNRFVSYILAVKITV